MRAKEAQDLGERIAARIRSDTRAEAFGLLAPVLAERTPFPMLDRIGRIVGEGALVKTNAFLRRVARERTEGGWPVIGSALGGQLDRDFAGALERCKRFTIDADIWYGADILGDRVAGKALVDKFDKTVGVLSGWREHDNHWVRRVIGVAVHVWTKRSRGLEAEIGRAQELLALLDPLFEETEINAVKGIGWGIKSIGKYYPDLVAAWLREQLVHRQRPHRTVMKRKALTYLDEKQRAHATGSAG